MPTSLRILRQRVAESFTLINLVTWVLYVWARVLLLIGRSGTALQKLGQAYRSTRDPRLQRLCAERLPALLVEFARPENPTPTHSIDVTFGNRLMVLKPRLPNEKGVLLVKFSELLKRIASELDMERLIRDYHVVIEPSWSGYFRQDVLYFARFDKPIFILAAEENDFALLRRLDSNLVPVPLGPCDWVDPRIAEPYLDQPKRFDIVMNSHWGALKRHYVFFAALRRMPDLSAALIGGNWAGGTRADLDALADHYGIADRLCVQEGIPFSEVMSTTCEAKISVLMSLKEGSNRALAESMFCDVPVLLLNEHVGGIRKNVVPETGVMVPQARLVEGIRDLLENRHRFSPRRWALENISCIRSTEILNKCIRDRALTGGETWTQDLLVRSNNPEPRYYDSANHHRMAAEHEHLRSYMV